MAGNDPRLGDARTPTAHSHAIADVSGLQGALDGKAASGHGHAIADVTNLQTTLDGKAAASHTHAIADTTGLQAALDGKAATAHSHAIADVTNLQTSLNGKQDTSAKGQANGYAGLGADGKVPSAQLPVSGSDPWTIVKLTSEFSTTLATAQDVPGLSFTPVAGTWYIVEAFLLVRTATATVNPRLGLAWPTGLTDGGAMLDQGQSATADILARGNPNAPLLVAVGGIPNTTQSWPAYLSGVALAGATPAGNVRVQVASETAGTAVRVMPGSYLRYRPY